MSAKSFFEKRLSEIYLPDVAVIGHLWQIFKTMPDCLTLPLERYLW